jgi:hypothetical protein
VRDMLYLPIATMVMGRGQQLAIEFAGG